MRRGGDGISWLASPHRFAQLRVLVSQKSQFFLAVEAGLEAPLSFAADCYPKIKVFVRKQV